MKETLLKQIVKWFLIPALMAVSANAAMSQSATVSRPFAIGTGTCNVAGSLLHYYSYNPNANTLQSTPNLDCFAKLADASGAAISFSANNASVAYNPKDQKVYYLWLDNSNTTNVWSWPVGTCPSSTSSRPRPIASFPSDILAVTFDADGNGWVIEFTGSSPIKAWLRKVDFATGTIGAADELQLTGGATITNSSAKDITISPSGQMFFVVNNKLFTPDYKSYAGTGKKLTCTYIGPVNASGDVVGLTYSDGEMVAAWNGTGCPFYEINPLTGVKNTVTKTGSIKHAANDLATVASGIGTAKELSSLTPTGVANQYTVTYDVYVHNYGNYPLDSVVITDNLANINGAANVSGVSVQFLSNPDGLTLNPGFNGVSNIKLIDLANLKAWPVAKSSFSVRITCTLSNIQPGVIYKNSAKAAGKGFEGQVVIDSSTNGNEPDPNFNDKPDDIGENQPTPLLIAVTATTPPCTSLQRVLYTETFGTGATTITFPGPNTVGTDYVGNITQPLGVDRYMLTSSPYNGDNGRWLVMGDHTTGSGRMMIVNADADSKVFFKDTVSGLCAGQQYSMFFFASYIGNPAYKTICDGFGGTKFPRVMMTIRDAATGLVITQISTDYITNNGTWQQYGLKWVMPSGYSNIVFELANNAQGGCGNDIAIDDISFGSCDPMPTVSAAVPTAGCIGGITTLRAIPMDPAVIPGPKEYQWQISNDGVTGWTNLGSVTTNQDYTINPLAVANTNKYYRVIMAAQGNFGSAPCRDTSDGFRLLAKTPPTAPTAAAKNKLRICPGDAVTLRVTGGTLGSNGVYTWYAGGCGTGTAVGTGATITVNPTVTTTYYVRIEDDCTVTSCVSVAVTVSCDIDLDDDGIIDSDELGGLDPMLDDDFDGIENYKDNNTPGFVDANGDNVDDRYDFDRDGVINCFDLDSDNDGIPDVVEAGGVDANGDGKIDNYTDTDNDGLSQNVDKAVGVAGSLGLGIPDFDGDGIPNMFDLDSDNDGIPDIREVLGADSNNDGKVDATTDVDKDGLMDIYDQDTNNDGVMDAAPKALLRTGADTNSDGKPETYPFKNLDKDAKPNPYDLDSDGDGIPDVVEAGFPDADHNALSDGARGAVTGWSTAIDGMAGPLVFRNSDTDPAGATNPDFLDIDSDNDGIPDNVEGLPTTNYRLPTNTDTDGDGIDNAYDSPGNAFGGAGIEPFDKDGDGTPDCRDLDSDNDTVPDVVEGNDFNNNHKADDDVTLTNSDADGDGLDDKFDADNTSARGTSRYMGVAGSLSGDASPGSRTMLQSTYTPQPDRDWRYIGSTLNVNFLSFTANRQGETVKLYWSITSDKPVAHFIVERSSDGRNFTSIGTVAAAADLSRPSSYNYSDNISNANGRVIYYRITAVSPVAAPKSTQVISVKRQAVGSLSLNPNPASTNVSISLGVQRDGVVEIRVLDATGRVVLQQQQQVYAGSNNFQLQGVEKLADGLYNVMVKTGDDIHYRKLIKQR
ncbi:T9SS type A sorting domain-containing protein [Pseudoflavitalea sp. G-6-1-2]|uniref:Ig-like domain-containing protein n=1 Tax=Pseudoflavitalea sp. G-6-1-2 TaxID=2728841 RepID=UPI00146DB2EF|nr:T9SS type A sorting domain-containing protein [Pseudoflavitalea sp. G-6-1-2]NML20510.1 T9SS type A sorting domain-containing protein [Pseudoflavitalea sp. G-6-1-2]